MDSQVQVAMRVRPLMSHELIDNCKFAITYPVWWLMFSLSSLIYEIKRRLGRSAWEGIIGSHSMLSSTRKRHRFN
jgi:hypothetical protein